MSSKQRYLRLPINHGQFLRKLSRYYIKATAAVSSDYSRVFCSAQQEFFTLHRRTLLTCLPAGGGRRGPVPPTHTQRKELSARKSLKTMSVNMMCQDVTSCNVFKNICNVLKILMHSKLKPAQDSLCMHCIGNLKSCILTNFTSHLSCLAIINAACGLFYFIF